eukprot:54718-Eustigmatos_ZCMA.PRE.1
MGTQAEYGMSVPEHASKLTRQTRVRMCKPISDRSAVKVPTISGHLSRLLSIFNSPFLKASPCAATMKVTILLSLFAAAAGKASLRRYGKQDGSSGVKTIGGTFQNELESCMSFEDQDDGSIKGVYNTKKGQASGNYSLAGLFNEREYGTTLAWVVAWHNQVSGDSHSATAWSGILSDDGNTIHSTWILVHEPEGWNDTNVGHDVFTRTDSCGWGR